MLVKAITAISLTAVLFLGACAPRGESKSLDQVYKISKARFQKVQAVEVSGESSKYYTDLLVKLDQLNVEKLPESINDSTSAIGDLLTELSFHSAYTNRPALGELATQYRLLGSNKSTVNPATVKLLLSRTYSLIASELETTKFQVG